MDENELKQIRLAQQGNHIAFEWIVTQYEKKIYGLCYHMMKNPEDALDVTQEVFIKLYKNLNSFAFESSFNTWITRIAGNACIDMMRKNKNQQITDSIQKSDNDNDEYTLELKDHKVNIEEQLIQKLEIEEVREALKQLNEEYRTAVVLRDMKQMSYEEISEILKCSLGTVKSRIARGRKQLQTIILDNRELNTVKTVKSSERRR